MRYVFWSVCLLCVGVSAAHAQKMNDWAGYSNYYTDEDYAESIDKENSDEERIIYIDGYQYIDSSEIKQYLGDYKYESVIGMTELEGGRYCQVSYVSQVGAQGEGSWSGYDSNYDETGLISKTVLYPEIVCEN
ncbi:MAG: hypothetical protein KDD52_07110 [Bdellovibrionales bacterium]|nr:hypothetical protein [Bdellovibrionales bacterium]